jgi:nicotinate phosphoribosyltransferase
MKKSPYKVTYPGKKQIFRQFQNGKLTRDKLGLTNESKSEGEGLLKLVMNKGDRLHPDDDLTTIGHRTNTNVTSLPIELRNINYTGNPPVEISTQLQQLTQELTNK